MVTENVAHDKSVLKICGIAQNVSRILVFMFYRSTAVVTLDETLVPVWLLKIASYSGFSFIRFGDVSCFMWYFCKGFIIQ